MRTSKAGKYASIFIARLVQGEEEHRHGRGVGGLVRISSRFSDDRVEVTDLHQFFLLTHLGFSALVYLDFFFYLSRKTYFLPKLPENLANQLNSLTTEIYQINKYLRLLQLARGRDGF